MPRFKPGDAIKWTTGSIHNERILYRISDVSEDRYLVEWADPRDESQKTLWYSIDILDQNCKLVNTKPKNKRNLPAWF